MDKELRRYLISIARLLKIPPHYIVNDEWPNDNIDDDELYDEIEP